ncbi:NfeD family protein [Thermodesulfatator autotrophicus]|uniref:Serine protease n=1 Tax=Thermodesulfatator autotrophicus TaxID=1795632 RepID=A0A177E5K3_9BACT|nr:nodulation protein NfeD [Thermodesulfatator autotrophicus]OAG27247.1 serine protease [Thermodesulfatator autotrophicus]
MSGLKVFHKFYFYFLVGFLLAFASQEVLAGEKVFILPIQEAITPLTNSKIEQAINRAEKEGAVCLIIELDTPGGLVSSTRKIVKNILSAEIPIVVYVYPSGAQAASAGTFITLAAHIAAMAPGTNIGAAHPVTMGQGKDKEMMKKAANDLAAFARSLAKLRGRNADWAEKAVLESVSITAEEALKLKVIDLIAENPRNLLQKINGRKVTLTKNREIILKTKDVQIITLKETLRDKILRLITNPNISYILLMLGLAGLYFELSNPGTILPGVVGVLCLILAFYSMHLLPVNYAGLLLILLSGVFFFLEIKLTSYGLLALAGLISLILGSLMLFDQSPEGLKLAKEVFFPILGSTALFFVSITFLAAKAALRKPTTGAEGLIGEEGKTLTPVSPKGGQVFVHGEIWQAVSNEKIPENTEIVVEKVEGFRLKVKKKS